MGFWPLLLFPIIQKWGQSYIFFGGAGWFFSLWAISTAAKWTLAEESCSLLKRDALENDAPYFSLRKLTPVTSMAKRHVSSDSGLIGSSGLHGEISDTVECSDFGTPYDGKNGSQNFGKSDSMTYAWRQAIVI